MGSTAKMRVTCARVVAAAILSVIVGCGSAHRSGGEAERATQSSHECQYLEPARVTTLADLYRSPEQPGRVVIPALVAKQAPACPPCPPGADCAACLDRTTIVDPREPQFALEVPDLPAEKGERLRLYFELNPGYLKNGRFAGPAYMRMVCMEWMEAEP